MKSRHKKSYNLALKLAIFLSLNFGAFSILFAYFEDYLYLLLLILVFFVISFYLIKIQIDNFIFQQVKDIYNEVSLSENLNTEPIQTDIPTLEQDIKKFAKTKKKEIDLLTLRENYRKEFIGNISHELNTPLFTTQSYILTLLDSDLDDPFLLKKYLSQAAKSVERLVLIVKDLEMLSRLEAGEITLNYIKFDIIEVIQSVFDLLEIQAKEKNISLLLEKNYAPIFVFADKDKIQQVVSNLVVNSIKYGKLNGTTEVSVEPTSSEKYLIRITDNGDGIGKEHIHRLFERFYRVDKTGNRKQGGSGLGLSIVKHIIEAHQQKIYVESSLGVGSDFSFTLEGIRD